MQKLKHINYTKLSPILSETVPSLMDLLFCHTSPAQRLFGDFCFIDLVLLGVVT
jgi:hypothetical protein